jgi:hypothetical protein
MLSYRPPADVHSAKYQTKTRPTARFCFLPTARQTAAFGDYLPLPSRNKDEEHYAGFLRESFATTHPSPHGFE